MKKLRLKNILPRIFALVVAVFLAVIVTAYDFNIADDLSYIYSTFIGQKSPYNGMIEVWNIDSFESGLKPKSTYLEECAKSFQKKYKGIYVMVRNLSLGECENLVKSGSLPDIISCSYGVANIFEEYFSAFENTSEKVYENFLSAGKKNGEVYGLAWCTGTYFLISTKSKLELAGKGVDDVKLNEIAYSCSYSFKAGKKEKFSKSLGFATGDYLMPKFALNAYNKARSIQIQESSEDELAFKSGYSAYTSFLSNESTILLGTHRDAYRMNTREENGKVSDVIYLPLTTWTDLVQFSFLCKGQDASRNFMAETFANFLTEESNQQKLKNVGMGAVTELNNDLESGVMSHIIPENFSNYEVKSVF